MYAQMEDVTDATGFWQRYSQLLNKDMPVLIRTGVAQSTFSTWRKKKMFPPVHVAYEIAKIAKVTVEYLVTGRETPKCSPKALEIANIADKLTEENFTILINMAQFFKTEESDIRLITEPEQTTDGDVNAFFNKIRSFKNPSLGGKPNADKFNDNPDNTCQDN
jgi:transcriptional regulator with XRE-family HTH domain